MNYKEWINAGNQLYDICTKETNTIENKFNADEFLNLSIDNNEIQFEWVCTTCQQTHVATLKEKIIDQKKCPNCFPNNKSTYKVGDKIGCLTVTGSSFEFMKKYKSKQIDTLVKNINELSLQRADYIKTHKDFKNNLHNRNYYDYRIHTNKNKLEYIQKQDGYIVKCNCGCTFTLYEDELKSGNRKYCTDITYKDNKRYRFQPLNNYVICDNLHHIQGYLQNHRYYDIIDNGIKFYPNDIFESFIINKYIRTTYECIRAYNSKTDVKGISRVNRWYKCTCYLCGQQYIFSNNDFEINTYTGQYVSANAKCNCHRYSFLQWQLTDIFNQLKISYRVEIAFEDLLGTSNKYLLTYDFGIYDEKDNLKALVEVQGQQHYSFCDDLQSDQEAFQKQQIHDNLKKEYAINHNIPLIEIPEIYDYEEIVKILAKNNVVKPDKNGNLPKVIHIEGQRRNELCKEYNNVISHNQEVEWTDQPYYDF